MAQRTKLWPLQQHFNKVVNDTGMPDAWKSPQEFATREEHEAAFETAERLKGLGFPEVKHLVPPLALAPDMIAAYAALGRPSDYPGWALVEMERGDPRTPWRGQDRRKGFAKVLPGAGVLVISGMQTKMGSQVRLLSGIDPVVEHHLVRAAGGALVCFDDPLDATRRMAGLIAAEGGLPAGWAWVPPANDTQPLWTMEPASLLGRQDDRAAIWWRGARGKWLIKSAHGRAWVWRNRGPVFGANGQLVTFRNVSEAKHFCETEDARQTPQY